MLQAFSKFQEIESDQLLVIFKHLDLLIGYNYILLSYTVSWHSLEIGILTVKFLAKKENTAVKFTPLLFAANTESSLFSLHVGHLNYFMSPCWYALIF